MELHKIMLEFNKNIIVGLLDVWSLDSFSGSFASNCKGPINCVTLNSEL